MESNHHIIAKEKHGSDHVDNIVRLDHKLHQRLHNLFGTILPHQQIGMMMDIASTAIRSNFRKDLIQVLGDNEGQYYKGHTMRNGIYVRN